MAAISSFVGVVVSDFVAALRYYQAVSSAANAPARSPQPTGFQRIWRVLRQLFYEVTGAIFAVLAFAWINAAFRSWTRDVAHWLIATAAGVAALFVFFAITSFRKARKL